MSPLNETGSSTEKKMQHDETEPVFSGQAEKEIAELLTHYPDKRSALIPVLNLAQKEFGYISESVMELVADRLDLTPPKVFEVVTFYTMLNQKPVGRYLIQLCRTLSCALVGAEDLLVHLKRKLGIGLGETTPDGLFTLKTVECLASCGTAPAMQVNGTFYEKLTAEKIDQILDDLRKGPEKPPGPMVED